MAKPVSHLIDDYEQLCRRIDAGERPDFLPFWGPIPSSGKTPGKGCLCQWWPSPFTLDGKTYHTAEHFMMAGKARLFGDANMEQRIIASRDPSEAQYLGRKVQGYDDALWCQHRFAIVEKGNWLKFSQHRELAQYLLATGSTILVSANPTDRIWSVGYDEDHPAILTPHSWRGANLLGFALMSVRARLLTADNPHHA
jgi:conserved hypothetical protein, ribA/ribD-fused